MTRDVDLVVCAYGRSPWLSRCLETLAPQARSGVRLTVTTSTPNEWIEQSARAHGARHVVNPHRRGIAADWNFALRTATAPLVTLCHQDDEYAPDYCAAMSAVFDLAPDVLYAACDHGELLAGAPRAASLLLRIKRLLIRRAFASAPLGDGPSIRRRLLSWGNPISCPGVMIHRALVPDFAFDESLSSNMDWDAWERLARRPGRIAYIDRRLVEHRVHAQSATTALIADSTRFAEDFAMLRRFWPRPVAAALFVLYRQAYRSNRV